jgi:hypothetical protein
LSLEDESNSILDKCSTQPISYNDYFVAWKKKFDDHNSKAEDKLPDFIDRIDAFVRIPPIRKELLGDNYNFEYEDLALALIIKHFPTVKFVGKLVLQTLCQILMNTPSIRTAEKLIFNSRIEDEDVFDLSSLPKQIRQMPGAESGLINGKERAVWEIKR